MNIFYGNEVPFVSLNDQFSSQMNQQNNIDSTQSSQISALENRIAVLEEMMSANEIKSIFNQLDNMQNGDSLNLTFNTNMNLTEKAITIKENTNVTIDLNSTTLNAQTPKLDAIIVEKGATATINGNGTVTAANDGNGFVIIARGNLVINGGSFKSGYDENKKDNACIYATGNGQIEIYGGRFETPNGAFVLNIKDSDRKTASIKAMGGEYVNFDPSNNASEGPNTNFVPEGYKVEVFTEGKNTIYRVVKA